MPTQCMLQARCVRASCNSFSIHFHGCAGMRACTQGRARKGHSLRTTPSLLGCSSNSTGDVRAVLVNSNGNFNTAGMIVVLFGCCTMLNGSATFVSAGKGKLFFEVTAAAFFS